LYQNKSGMLITSRHMKEKNRKNAVQFSVYHFARLPLSSLIQFTFGC